MCFSPSTTPDTHFLMIEYFTEMDAYEHRLEEGSGFIKPIFWNIP